MKAVILESYVMQEGDLDWSGVAVLSNPAWQQLTAVQEENYYYMDKDLYHLKPNARWGEAYEQLVDILYGA